MSKTYKPTAKQIAANNDAIQAAAREIEKEAEAAKPAPAKPEAEKPKNFADHLAEWRKLTHDNKHTAARLAISKWCADSAGREADEFRSIADDFAYILGAGDDELTPDLADFRMDLTDELMERVKRVFGSEGHAAIMATL